MLKLVWVVFFCPLQFETFDCSFLCPHCFHSLFLKQSSLKARSQRVGFTFCHLKSSVLYITPNEFCQSFLHIHLSMRVCNCSLFVHDSNNLWGCYCPFFFIPNCVNSSFISLEVMELLVTYIHQYYRQRHEVCIVLWIQFFVITCPWKELHMKRWKWRFCGGSEHANMDEALKLSLLALN